MHPVWPCHCHHICFQLSIFPFCLLLLLLHGWWINQSSLYAQHSSQLISNVYFFSQIHSIGNSNWVISDWIQKSVRIQCFGWSFLVCCKYDPTFCGKYNLPPLPLKSDDVITIKGISLWRRHNLIVVCCVSSINTKETLSAIGTPPKKKRDFSGVFPKRGGPNFQNLCFKKCSLKHRRHKLIVVCCVCSIDTKETLPPPELSLTLFCQQGNTLSAPRCMKNIYIQIVYDTLHQ